MTADRRKTIVIGARIDVEIKELLDNLALVDLGDIIRSAIEQFLFSNNGDIDMEKLKKEVEQRNREDELELERIKSLREYYINEIKRLELQMQKIQERIRKRNESIRNIHPAVYVQQLKKQRIKKEIEKLKNLYGILDPSDVQEWLSKMDTIYPVLENVAKRNGVSVSHVFRILEEMYNVNILQEGVQ